MTDCETRSDGMVCPKNRTTTFCQNTVPTCRNKYSRYKNICDQAFECKEPNYDAMTDEELSTLFSSYKKLLIKNSDCANKRKDFRSHCVDPTCQDEGHNQAINIAETNKNNCDVILNEITNTLTSRKKEREISRIKEPQEKQEEPTIKPKYKQSPKKVKNIKKINQDEESLQEFTRITGHETTQYVNDYQEELASKINSFRNDRQYIDTCKALDLLLQMCFFLTVTGERKESYLNILASLGLNTDADLNIVPIAALYIVTNKNKDEIIKNLVAKLDELVFLYSEGINNRATRMLANVIKRYDGFIIKLQKILSTLSDKYQQMFNSDVNEYVKNDPIFINYTKLNVKYLLNYPDKQKIIEELLLSALNIVYISFALPYPDFDRLVVMKSIIDKLSDYFSDILHGRTLSLCLILENNICLE
jgi:hypothetical protein